MDELWRDQTGDILLFLSGEREIRETAESLRKHHPQGCDILPLYSRLAQDEQERVFRPSGRRRIVLATNVAETSLTVPGIRAVIDTGVARISRYSHRSRLQRLPIEKISQASANQRTGRCGRVGPGIAIRLYSEEDYLARPEFTEPEIQRTNLAAVILQMHALKLGDIEAFPFVEPPDGRYVRDGQRTLREINALTDEGQLTEMGRRLARLPLDPRLGRILLAGVDEKCLEEVAIIAAALSVPDPRDRPADKQTQADQKHALLRDEQSDFLSLLKLWRAYAEQREHLSRAKLRGWCRENFLSYLRLTEWHDVHGQVMEVVKGELALKLNGQPAQVRGHPPGAARRSAVAGGAAQGAGRVPRRQRHQAAHPSGLGAVQGEAAVDREREQVETTKVYARNVARVDPLWDRAGGRASGASPALRTALGKTRGARLDLRAHDPVRADAHAPSGSVPFERIDPKAARELFIRHALVRMEYDSARALPHPQPEAAGGSRIPAAERPARGPAGRREPAVRILRCARAGGHLHRRGFRALAAGSRGARTRSSCGSPSRTSPPAMPSSRPSSFPDHLSAGPLVVQLTLPLRARP